MKIICVILCFIAVMLLIAMGAWYAECYYGNKNLCAGKITFSQFKALYSIKPDNWELHDSYVAYLTYNGNPIYRFTERNYLYFSVADTIRYQLWHNDLEKQRKQSIKNDEFKKVLDGMQKDLEEYRENLENN